MVDIHVQALSFHNLTSPLVPRHLCPATWDSHTRLRVFKVKVKFALKTTEAYSGLLYKPAPVKYQESFRAKTTYLHTWRGHRRYDYVINRTFFTGIYIHFALTREISSWTLEDKIHIHTRACNILYFCKLFRCMTWLGHISNVTT